MLIAGDDGAVLQIEPQHLLFPEERGHEGVAGRSDHVRHVDRI
jgi:hypothetical protein